MSILPCGLIGYFKLRDSDARHNAIMKKGEQIYVDIDDTKYRLNLPDDFKHKILDIILDKDSMYDNKRRFYDSSLTIFKEFEFICINGQKVRNANIFNCENIFEEESSDIILPCEEEQHRIAYSVKMTEMNDIVEEQLKVYLAKERTDSPVSVEKGDCNICLDTQYLHNCITLPCSHSFHIHCISTWFTTNKSCPTCRSTKIGGDPFYSRGYNLTYALLNMELKKYF